MSSETEISPIAEPCTTNACGSSSITAPPSARARTSAAATALRPANSISTPTVRGRPSALDKCGGESKSTALGAVCAGSTCRILRNRLSVNGKSDAAVPPFVPQGCSENREDQHRDYAQSHDGDGGPADDPQRRPDRELAHDAFPRGHEH